MNRTLRLSFFRLSLLMGLPLLMAACGSSTHAPKTFTAEGLDTLYAPRYASGFEMFRSGKNTLVHIINPWQGASDVSQWVFLSRDGKEPPAGFTGTVIKTPIRRAVCMSASYVAAFDALGCDSVICGISGVRFINSPAIRERSQRDAITEVGYDSGLNYEALVKMQPDAIFMFGLTEEKNSMTSKLSELSLPYVYIGDYVENNPLGRAEWLCLFGECMDRRSEAIALFDSIAREYETAHKLVAQRKERPSVMLNAPWHDSWFVPGDRSYMVRLIEDGGGSYVCHGEDTDQSRPISIETAFIAASKADFWLSPGSANTLTELKAMNPKFGEINAIRRGRVFNNNARLTPAGGSDFWESGSIYPDRTLKDLIRILHPELLPNHTLYYFHQLK